MNPPELFLSCDWGTSRFRLRLADLDANQILAEFTSDAGVAKLASEAPTNSRADLYQQVLQQGIAQLQQRCEHDLAQLPVVLSGMASSSLGWQELPYANLPFDLSGTSAVWKNLGPLCEDSKRTEVYLISGVSSAEDVMRGEETEALGAWALAADQLSGEGALIILPGTHSKHVILKQGQIVDFHTYMTGELFDVLSKHSVLKHSLPGNDTNSANNWAEVEAPFMAGVQLGVERPLENALFLVRTGSLLSGRSPAESAALLSGMLIGNELISLKNSDSSELPILLCASGELSVRYQAALRGLKLSQPLHVLEESQVSQLATRGQAVLLASIRGQ